LKKTIFFKPYLVNFSLLWVQNTHFSIGRREKKKKRLSTLALEFFLPIQIQLLGIENPNNPKIDSPWCRCDAAIERSSYSACSSFPLCHLKIRKKLSGKSFS
jgi:hypothetical protein